MERRRREATTWTRGLCVAAVAAPALGLGAVHPWAVPITAALVLGWLLSLRSAPTRWPMGLAWLLLLAAVTALQALPLPSAISGALAPVGHVRAQALWAPLPEPPWLAISIAPGITAFESMRLCVLIGVAWAAAQTPWRVVARAIVWVALAVLLIGIAQLAFDSQRIFGVYVPRTRPSTSGLLTTFVNPNHQCGLFLLGLFSAWALRRDRVDALMRHDTGAIAWGAATLALAAGIALSVSRAGTLALIIAASVALLWRGPSSQRNARVPAYLAIAALALGTALVSFLPRLGARLSPLLSSAESGVKFSTARDALELIAGAPWLGTGRGTAIDLLPIVGHAGLPVTSHIEVAPVTMLVEWGPLVGGAALVGSCVCFVATAKHRGDARRVLVLGVAAWALHNLADFNWEFLGTATAATAAAATMAPRVRKPPAWGAKLALGVTGLALFGGGLLTGVADSLAPLEPAPLIRARHSRPLDARVHLARARASLGLAADPSTGKGAREAALVAARLQVDAAEAQRETVDAAMLRAELQFAHGDYEGFATSIRVAWSRAQLPQRRALLAWLAESPEPLRTLSIAASPPQPARDFFSMAREQDAMLAQDLVDKRLVFDPLDSAALEAATRLAQARHERGEALAYATRWAAADAASGPAVAALALCTAEADPTQLQAAIDDLPDDPSSLSRGELIYEARARLRLRTGLDLQASVDELQGALRTTSDEAARARIRNLLQQLDRALTTARQAGNLKAKGAIP